MLIVSAAWGQIEATAPGTGRLYAEALRYEGKPISAGMTFAETIDVLGNVKIVQKPERTSSTKLSSQMGLLIPFFARAVTLKCGVCWISIVEKTLGKNEAIRIVLIGPEEADLRTAALVLDKAKNGYGRSLDDVWEGTRDIYLGEEAFRWTQDRSGFKVEQLDLKTGETLITERPMPAPTELKRRLRTNLALVAPQSESFVCSRRGLPHPPIPYGCH